MSYPADLITTCIKQILTDLGNHKENLKYLPRHIKDRILTIINNGPATKNCTDSGVLDCIESLVHRETERLNFSLIVTNSAVLKAVRICENLKFLTFGEIITTPQELTDLFTHFNHLTSLESRNNQFITDDVTESISRCCPRLKILNIGGSLSITDKTLIALATNSEFLIGLDLSYSKVTSKGIEILVTKRGKTLVDLRFNHCDNITNEAMIHINKHCTNLKLLFYNHCKNISVHPSHSNKHQLAMIAWTIPF